MTGRPRSNALAQCVRVERVQHERLVRKRDLSLDDDLGNPAPRGAQPALSHSSTEPQGSTSMISTPAGASSRSASGVPVSSPNVPQ